MKKVIILVPLVLILIVYGVSKNVHVILGINLLKTTYSVANIFETKLEQKSCNNSYKNYLEQIKNVVVKDSSISDFIQNIDNPTILIQCNELLEKNQGYNPISKLSKFLVNQQLIISLVNNEFVKAGSEKANIVIGFQNAAELRSTGGLIGYYAILTVENANLSNIRYLPNDELPLSQITTSNYPDEFFKLYGDQLFASNLNDNASSHFPYAAQSLIEKFTKYLQEPVSMFMVIEPSEYWQTYKIFNTNKAIDSKETFIQYLYSDLYKEFPEDQNKRYQSLESLFPSLDQELLNILSPRNALKLYRDFTSSKSTHIYSTKNSTNKILDAINKSGNLDIDRGDVFVGLNNIGENKLDQFLKTSMKYCYNSSQERLFLELTFAGDISRKVTLPNYMSRRGDLLMPNTLPNSNRLMLSIDSPQNAKIDKFAVYSEVPIVNKSRFVNPLRGTQRERDSILIPFEVLPDNVKTNVNISFINVPSFDSSNLHVTNTLLGNKITSNRSLCQT
jgi:hypothetical protein